MADIEDFEKWETNFFLNYCIAQENRLSGTKTYLSCVMSF